MRNRHLSVLYSRQWRPRTAVPIREVPCMRSHRLVAVVPLALLIASSALASACASKGATPRPFPLPGASAPAAPGSASGTPHGYVVSSTALALRGAPYQNGGTTPSGFDCSGFVQYVYARHGLAMPRETREQFRVGRKVSRQRLEPGDLVFFTTVAPGASHVGISLGGEDFVHAPSERGVVRVERLSSSYWNRRYVGARRPR
jgi:cell wall-associated NlpC family hydrolase